jgi:Spy/CpxP family protein refolding chaperone
MRLLPTLALLVLLPTAALAQQPPGPPPGVKAPPEPHELLEEHAEALGVDAETVARIQEIATAAKGDRERLAQAVEQARRDLGALLEAEQPDREAVLAQVDVLGAAETAVLRQHMETLLDIHALLTPQQLKALEAMAPRPPAGGPPPGMGGPPPHGAPPKGGPGGPMLRR